MIMVPGSGITRKQTLLLKKHQKFSGSPVLYHNAHVGIVSTYITTKRRERLGHGSSSRVYLPGKCKAQSSASQYHEKKEGKEWKGGKKRNEGRKKDLWNTRRREVQSN
jgi:hypothetical protein